MQAEDLFGALPTIVVLPLTSALADLPLTRVTMAPSEANGLRVPSQVMVSRPQSALREQIGAVIGHAEASAMVEVGQKTGVADGADDGRRARHFLKQPGAGPNDKGRDHSRPFRFSAWRRYQVRRDISSLSQGFLASMVRARSSMRGRPFLTAGLMIMDAPCQR